MRTDHFAYQRATKVAGVGLLMQIVIGIGLLVFGMLSSPPDLPLIYAALYVLPGVLVWLGLVIVFHQHKLERLESLEEDELAAARGTTKSVFDQSREESRVAERRLGLMHKWFLPGLSLLLVALLVLLAWPMLKHMRGLTGANRADFTVTDQRGWAVAICLFLAAVSFIYSRFVAGMAKQKAWANLRGGAAYTVGNALVLVAIAIGIIFRFLENEKVIYVVTWGIPILMGLIAAEVTLNFILNLYRPRIPGEVQRPAFDSKGLSLLAAPDNIVRSLNEAVNYQFGFDVTSSWGYQLLLRSIASLVALGVIALVLLSTMVVVEPHQQAIRLRGGAMVGDKAYRSGIMWKRPWPLETAEVYDVSRLRSLWLTAKVVEARTVNLWSNEAPKTDVEVQPFIVATPAAQRVAPTPAVPGIIPALPTTMPAATTPVLTPPASDQATGEPPSAADVAAQAVSAVYSLVEAEVVLQYRIKADGGLLDYLRFANDNIARLQTLTNRERALRSIALSVVSSELSRRSLDDVLSPGRSELTRDLAAKVQAALDAKKAGVEVVAIEIPNLRPSGSSAEAFEELGIGLQGKQKFVAEAQRNLASTFTYIVGDNTLTQQVLEGIDAYNALKVDKPEEAARKRVEVEQLMLRGGGAAAQTIADAERDRWVQLMSRKAQAAGVRSQLASYRAAPELFRQREIMRVYAQLLPNIDKYILGIDPSRVRIDMDLKEVNPILDFAGASADEVAKTQQQ